MLHPLGHFRDRDARGVRGDDRVVGHVLLHVGDHLLLELELLGHGLGHHLRALERGRQVGLEAHAAAVGGRRAQPVEHSVRDLYAALARSSASALTS